MHFTDDEVNRIVSLFDDARHVCIGNALTFVESVRNDRSRVTSCVYRLNFNLDESCITMSSSLKEGDSSTFSEF